MNNSYDVGLVIRAIEFAAQKHRMQRRKDSDASPYINHPIAVMRLLTECGFVDPVVLASAALHDTIEDTETTEEELRTIFGGKVTGIVVEMTDDKTLPVEVRKQKQIENAPHLSREAALVKLADKTCNLRDAAANPPVGWSLERRSEYFDWAKAVVDELPEVSEPLRGKFDAAYAARPNAAPGRRRTSGPSSDDVAAAT
jgi:GTP diphosphokinase / guanosine-3',5'-bis(diphosphate) 3'-diphosphatase